MSFETYNKYFMYLWKLSHKSEETAAIKTKMAVL